MPNPENPEATQTQKLSDWRTELNITNGTSLKAEERRRWVFRA